MRTLVSILLLLLFTSCEYDYIHTNPDHPEGYGGRWMCDSIYVNNKLFSKEPKANFLELYQPEMGFNGMGYSGWKVNQNETPNKLMGYNTYDVPLITFDVIRVPMFHIDGLKLELKLDNTIYYLTNTMN